jgi:hypothetical protein
VDAEKGKYRTRHAPNSEQRTMATFPSTPVSPPMPELYPAIRKRRVHPTGLERYDMVGAAHAPLRDGEMVRVGIKRVTRPHVRDVALVRWPLQRSAVAVICGWIIV